MITKQQLHKLYFVHLCKPTGFIILRITRHVCIHPFEKWGDGVLRGITIDKNSYPSVFHVSESPKSYFNFERGRIEVQEATREAKVVILRENYQLQTSYVSKFSQHTIFQSWKVQLLITTHNFHTCNFRSSTLIFFCRHTDVADLIQGSRPFGRVTLKRGQRPLEGCTAPCLDWV